MTKKIGGRFPSEPTMPHENGYFARVCPPDGDLVFTMSGRCGTYLCLEDILLRDTRKVAYVPMYTCETVLAPFEKAGYSFRFYEVDDALRSVFDDSVIDEISLISLCGYYGFCNYDRDFVRRCKERGVIVIEDVTHSLFSDGGIDPLTDYAAGSFRKWSGVACGGFAMKRSGKFGVAPLPLHQQHVQLRHDFINGSDEMFWEGEMLLRRIFDRFAGDEESEYIMRHMDVDTICRRRRENFAAVLASLPADLRGIRPVFPQLTDGTVPSHFCLYAEKRDAFQAFMEEHHIHTTVYWPAGPLIDLTGHETVRYVYDHIVSFPCDQRWSPEDMRRITEVLIDYSDRFED